MATAAKRTVIRSNQTSDRCQQGRDRHHVGNDDEYVGVARIVQRQQYLYRAPLEQKATDMDQGTNQISKNVLINVLQW
ncbi:MAG: hypothetical protein GY953_17265 [bacterium]|nr:hypothetical protein [bacterium]